VLRQQINSKPHKGHHCEEGHAYLISQSIQKSITGGKKPAFQVGEDDGEDEPGQDESGPVDAFPDLENPGEGTVVDLKERGREGGWVGG
jgi:hypothetical protein